MEEDLVRDLEKSRPFVGQTESERRALESLVKERYAITDYVREEGTGYKIHDNEREEDIYFVPNARLTLETRYLEKNENKEVIENALDLFARVAVNIAEADLKYNSDKDIKSVADEFLESMLYQRFMPNTPTLCNAGRALQQLSACFVLPVEDYMATDDIGEDAEKQGNGIYDVLRYMAMIHKSGGGTGFNFSHLRPRSDMISTTFGSSSGPVPFIKVFDSSTDAVNQGGFRRGANMAILNYTHPDILEFINEKTNGTLVNFNLSVGIDDKFMQLVKDEGYFRLVNPKRESDVPLEERVWKKENVLEKGTRKYDELFGELNPSLIVDEGKVINIYSGEEIGKVADDETLLINAHSLFDYISECAWKTGCPGIVFLDRLEQRNTVPHVGRIESTNPCGEQPLLPFEACNLGGINLANCVNDSSVDYSELENRIGTAVHFLDNVIDMSKFPFQKIYGKVHGTRKIGLGMMGWAEMLAQLGMAYDSEEAVELAKGVSDYVTETARKKSVEIAEERGVFPYWEGSVWEKEGLRVRNATVTTIAPNGTTGMICNVSGGVEPFFRLAFKKTCMDGKELIYRNPLLEGDLYEQFDKVKLEGIIKTIEKIGSVREMDVIPEEIQRIYATSHDIAPEWHVRMQAAFQVGNGVGVDNAVSKTVNLPEDATVEDVLNTYKMAYDEGCVGITIFRDNSKKGVLSGLEKRTLLVQNNVSPHEIVNLKAQALKYKVKRPNNGDSLHITITSNIYVDDEGGKAYFIPDEIFQTRAPLGHATSVSFAQSGMDRTEILRQPNPNYAELIGRLQSASSNEEEGLGPRKIKSIEHAAGVVLEDCLLKNGIVGNDDNGRLINLVHKSELRKVEEGTDEYMSLLSQVRVTSSDEELLVSGNHGKLDKAFVCEACGNEEYTFEAGCNHPKCTDCGEIQGGGCG